jgi:hypothetical protein
LRGVLAANLDEVSALLKEAGRHDDEREPHFEPVVEQFSAQQIQEAEALRDCYGDRELAPGTRDIWNAEIRRPKILPGS